MVQQDDKIQFIPIKYDNPSSIELFKEFYEKIYCQEFPDPDERDSWDEFLGYLSNFNFATTENYYIEIVMMNKSVAGGGVFDYLPDCNWGVIEYLAIGKQYQNKGLGSTLLKHIHEKLEEVSIKNSYSGLRAVAIEVNDPKTTELAKDNGNTLERLNFWRKAGYKLFEFPYCQPALGDDRCPVSNLLLLGYIPNRDTKEYIDTQEVKAFIKDYFSSGNWISNIEANDVIKKMFQWFAIHDQIAMLEIEVS